MTLRNSNSGLSPASAAVAAAAAVVVVAVVVVVVGPTRICSHRQRRHRKPDPVVDGRV